MYTFTKFLVNIHQKLIQKIETLMRLYVFLVTYCKIFHLKNPFYEKMKMTQKKGL
jgi:hypothetical protein